ncbi:MULTISPECIES: fibronectin type III domain-containing protein [Bacillus cereus group]|uniref:fibronectin type III domain-containing protein n=1 Tax=Bacillus cereus group TaxID=86661 RepID=UPI001C73231F|nr:MULTISPECIES: fibronectin type III domain-containing protein [Bacillus cereus group]MBX0351823.1 fibronectin type III domain-containing protein [Bacillus toyonensis]MDA2716766.1 fibronectin type III domain-containing protein [Bacillus cereus group sp. Bc025]
MRFKKLFAMVSFVVILSLSVLPSFASANSYLQPLKNGDDYILVQSYQYGTGVDVNKKYTSLNKQDDFVVDLGESMDLNSIKFHTFNAGPNGYRGAEIRFFDNDGKMLLGYSLEEFKYFDKEYYQFANTIKGARYVRFTYNSFTGDGFLFYEFIVTETKKGKTGAFPPKGNNAVLPNDVGVNDVILPMIEIENLNAVAGVNDINFNWTNPSDSNFNGVQIYNGESLVATLNKDAKSYNVRGLEADKNYNFRFVSMYGNGISKGVQKEVKTLVDPKKVPPSNVTNLKVSDIKSTSVKLSWVNPSDNDLKGLRIFNGDKLIAETGIVDNFLVKDLKPNTSYEFKVVAVDNDSNLSGSSTVRATTLEFADTEPPEAPKGLAVKQGSESLFLTWKNNTEKDLAGYNVYLDGKKVNSTLVDNPFFTLRSLKNDANYKVQISAVDKSGNESILSSVVIGTPISSGLPIVGTDYSLNDITLGISEFFGSFWLIIAFAVSIPLSFYIAARVKLLFLD